MLMLTQEEVDRIKDEAIQGERARMATAIIRLHEQIQALEKERDALKLRIPE